MISRKSREGNHRLTRRKSRAFINGEYDLFS